MKELSERTGAPQRLIRFLISQSVIHPPTGGKKYAKYDDSHVNAIEVYMASKREGVGSLDVIRQKIALNETRFTLKLERNIEVSMPDGLVEDVESFKVDLEKLVKKHVKREK